MPNATDHSTMDVYTINAVVLKVQYALCLHGDVLHDIRRVRAGQSRHHWWSIGVPDRRHLGGL